MRSLVWSVLLVATIATRSFAAEIPEADVMLKTEIEDFGVTHGLTPVGLPDSSGGYAMALGDERTGATGAVKLQPGEYTLLVRAWAPAGDQDGFFVDIRDKRTRRVAPGQQWTAMAYNFSVEKEEVVTIAIVGQETGLTVDQIAVVRGTFKDNEVRLSELPGETGAGQIAPTDLPRLASHCSLKEVPEAPFETVFHESFDGETQGAVGDHSQIEGKFGNALYLQSPDGRFDVDASALDLGPTGTIEYWLRPRPAQRFWHDQGWHYFIHCEPAAAGGFQLDLSRHPKTQLRLTATMGGQPYHLDAEPSENVQLSTSKADLEAWHHLLVSWDLTGERQYLWLLFDGAGVQLFFEPCFEPSSFSRIEIANTPSTWEVPFLPIDGAIDELRISNVSVADRLAD